MASSRQRIRVLHLIRTNDLCDGIARHVLTLVRNFGPGVAPAVCIAHPAGPLGAALTAAGVPHYALDAAHGHDLRSIFRFRSILREFGPDVIHGHLPPVSFQFAIGTMRQRVPVVETLHGIPAMPRHGGVAGRASRALLRMVTARYRACIHQTLAVSAATGAWYQGNGRVTGPLQTLFNPVALKDMPAKEPAALRRELGLREDTRLIGMAGRLAAVKDWPSFLEICRRVTEKDPRVHGVAVGDGPLAGELKAEADRLGLREHLHWLGYRPDAPAVVGALDVALMTSHKEGMPTVLLEAMAMRTPVAGFVPPGGTEEVLAYEEELGGTVASLIRERDPAAVADVVMRLLSNPAEAARQAARGQELVRRHFDATVVCSELEKIYRRLAERG